MTQPPRRSPLAWRSPPVAVAPQRLCAVIPTYDNPRTIARVARTVAQTVRPVLVVDDGSGPEASAELDALDDGVDIIVVRRPQNGGKGAAVRSGLQAAAQRGFTHAVQVDADGQHDLAQLPALVAASRAHPTAAIVGAPIFDASAPASRLQARKITRFWVHIETFGRIIDDAMVGFRVYPIGATCAVGAAGNRMDFDIEVVVRLAWSGVPIVNFPVAVRYLSADEGGVSHFRALGDNVAISWLHTRLFFEALARAVVRYSLGWWLRRVPPSGREVRR